VRRGSASAKLSARHDDLGARRMDDQLEARLRRVEDILEIQQLFVDYIEYLDNGDVEAYAGLFAADGQVNLGMGGRATGHEEIKELISKVVVGKTGNAFHIVSSPIITLDGDRATAQVMWTVIDTDPEGKPVVTLLGRHLDELVREDGRWRFQKRKGRLDIPKLPRPA
jgi:uncharacterized protein (TIGR02246 family)